MKISSRWDPLLDMVFPKLCMGCGRPGEYVCRKCQMRYLRPYHFPICHVCRVEARSHFVHHDCQRFTYLDGVFPCYIYNDFIEKLVLDAKYHLHYDVLQAVADFMLDSPFFEIVQRLNPDVVSWVPLSGFKKRWRGFNQTEILARVVAQKLDAPALALLSRDSGSHSQVGTGREDRMTNLQGTFRMLQGISMENKRVLLVDDVMTTGATLEQCAKVLKQAGAREVYATVFARGIVFPQTEN